MGRSIWASNVVWSSSTGNASGTLTSGVPGGSSPTGADGATTISPSDGASMPDSRVYRAVSLTCGMYPSSAWRTPAAAARTSARRAARSGLFATAAAATWSAVNPPGIPVADASSFALPSICAGHGCADASTAAARVKRQAAIASKRRNQLREAVMCSRPSARVEAGC